MINCRYMPTHPAGQSEIERMDKHTSIFFQHHRQNKDVVSKSPDLTNDWFVCLKMRTNVPWYFRANDDNTLKEIEHDKTDKTTNHWLSDSIWFLFDGIKHWNWVNHRPSRYKRALTSPTLLRTTLFRVSIQQLTWPLWCSWIGDGKIRSHLW